MKLRIYSLLLFSTINSRAFTNLACLAKGLCHIPLSGSALLSISIRNLAFNIVFRQLLECLVRLTSCTGFIMISYIDAIYHFLSAVYKLWRTYLLPNFWGTLFEFSNPVYHNFTIEVCVVKLMVIIISGLTFEWGMLFRSEI